MPREKAVPGLENAHDDDTEDVTKPAKIKGDRVFLTMQGKDFLIPEGSKWPKDSQIHAPVSIQFNNWTYRTAKPEELEYLIHRSQTKGDIAEIHPDRQQEAIREITTGEIRPVKLMQLMRLQ